MSNDALITGKSALITGASSGIGAAMTRRLAQAGARIALVGRNESRLRSIASEIPDNNHLLLECDVRDDSNVRAAVAEAESALGGIDILVNSAGLFHTGPLSELTNERWQELWETNVNGTIFPTRAVLSGMLARHSGVIVIISSVAAHRGFRFNTAYSATKYAVTGFARSLTSEVRREGVRVVNAFIGPVDTPIWDGKDTPLPREELLTPEEVAEAITAAITVSDRQVIEDVLLLPQQGIYP